MKYEGEMVTEHREERIRDALNQTRSLCLEVEGDQWGPAGYFPGAFTLYGMNGDDVKPVFMVRNLLRITDFLRSHLVGSELPVEIEIGSEISDHRREDIDKKTRPIGWILSGGKHSYLEQK